MKQCLDYEYLLQDYLDGYLLSSQRELLEEHLRGCVSCRTLLNGMQRLEARFDGIGAVEPPPELDHAIFDAIPEGLYRPTSPGRQWASLALVPVLALVIFLAGVFSGGSPGGGSLTAGRQVEIIFFAPEAASVMIVGDFNSWSTAQDAMRPAGEDGLWRASLKLAPGVYQYGFLIDGRRWVADPQAESGISDGFGGRNSLLFVEG